MLRFSHVRAADVGPTHFVTLASFSDFDILNGSQLSKESAPDQHAAISSTPPSLNLITQCVISRGGVTHNSMTLLSLCTRRVQSKIKEKVRVRLERARGKRSWKADKWSIILSWKFAPGKENYALLHSWEGGICKSEPQKSGLGETTSWAWAFSSCKRLRWCWIL
jgi:hypothetical protein